MKVVSSDWSVFGDVITKIPWVKTPEEDQQEIKGIVDGVSAIDYVYEIYRNLILDIKLKKGNRILTQNSPGSVPSGPDWCMNSSGLMVIETTIAGFFSFDPKGIPETIRLKKLCNMLVPSTSG